MKHATRPSLLLALLGAPALAGVVSAPLQAPLGSAAVGVAGVAGVSVRAPLAAPLSAPTLSLVPTLTAAPSLSVTPAVRAALPSASALAVPQAAAAPQAAAEAAITIAGPVLAVPQAAPRAAVEAAAAPQAAPLPGLVAARQAVAPESKPSASPEASGWRLSRLFDGLARRGVTADPTPAVAGTWGTGRSRLANAAAEPAPKKAIPAPKPEAPATRRLSWPLRAALTAFGVFLAAPGIALAAVPAAAAAAPGIATIAALSPIASALAAAAGGVYGLIVSSRKGESSGEMFASVLRYGMLAGAGVYVLLGLTQGVFMGMPGAGLEPLPTAMATAALGQGAFQGRFADADSTPADRLMSAFPAIAGALGLSVGIIFFNPSLLTMAATGAMSLTGVASALYAAIYKPGVSPAEGPKTMARGFVLQGLMSGLALAMTNPWLAAPFTLLAAWGLWDVMATTGRAVLAFPAFKRR